VQKKQPQKKQPLRRRSAGALLKGFFFSMLTVTLAAAGAVGILLKVHDYPQTTQIIERMQVEEGHPRWIATFYFINEAASGIKYALTGNPRHFQFFPSLAFVEDKRKEFFVVSLGQALVGDWCAQLTVSGLYARGLGREADAKEAVRWYAIARVRAEQISSSPDDFFMRELMLFEQTFAPLLESEEDLQGILADVRKKPHAPAHCRDHSPSEGRPAA